MLRVRIISTKVGSRSVQIVRYADCKRYIIKHIGTGNTDEELSALKQVALMHVEELTRQSSLFPDVKSSGDILMLNQCEYRGFYHTFLYEVLRNVKWIK